MLLQLRQTLKTRKALTIGASAALVLCVALIAGPAAGTLTALGVAPLLVSLACLLPCMLPVLLLRKKGSAESAAPPAGCGTQEHQSQPAGPAKRKVC